MLAGDAIAKRCAMHASVGSIDELHAAVAERVAIRQPPGEWDVMRYRSAVRLFVRTPDGYLSRYVWRWRMTDATIDLLLVRGKRKGLGG